MEQVSRHTECFNPCPLGQITCRSSTPNHKAIPQPTYISHTHIHNSNSFIHLHTVSFSHTAKTTTDSLSLLVLHTGTQLAARWRVEQFFTQDWPVTTRCFNHLQKCLPLTQSPEIIIHLHQSPYMSTLPCGFFLCFLWMTNRPDSRRVPNSHPSDEGPQVTTAFHSTG